MHEVTTPQIALLLIAVALLAAGVGLSLSRIWWERKPENAQRTLPRVGAKACYYAGLMVALGTLLWHSAGRESWFPLEDNFDALVWLGLLLALFVLFTQLRHPLRGLDWFVMPFVVLLFVSAAVFGRAKPHEYVDTTWEWVHRLTAYGGAAAFAVGCAGGTMFLIVSHRLRSKSARPAGARPPPFGSLERLEHLMLVSVTVGFALLTIGAVTGLVMIAKTGTGGTRLGPHWFLSPKLLLSAGAWVVYAVVLHSPMNPTVRGRRAALLSVIGFVLMIGILVAVQFMPK
jgi:ABC-type uncharacterized transport system permease subunit